MGRRRHAGTDCTPRSAVDHGRCRAFGESKRKPCTPRAPPARATSERRGSRRTTPRRVDASVDLDGRSPCTRPCRSEGGCERRGIGHNRNALFRREARGATRRRGRSRMPVAWRPPSAHALHGMSRILLSPRRARSTLRSDGTTRRSRRGVARRCAHRGNWCTSDDLAAPTLARLCDMFRTRGPASAHASNLHGTSRRRHAPRCATRSTPRAHDNWCRSQASQEARRRGAHGNARRLSPARALRCPTSRSTRGRSCTPSP